MTFDNVVVLCPREAVSLEPVADGIDQTGFSLAEDAVEEMVVCLAAIEAAWAAGEFGRIPALLGALEDQARRAGLPDVVHVSRSVGGILKRCDEVALAAVISRLIRVGETSLATLLEITYLKI